MLQSAYSSMMTSALKTSLRRKVIHTLGLQGYAYKANRFSLSDAERDTLRSAHLFSRAERIIENETMIVKKSDFVKSYMVSGKDLEVDKIDPILIEVETGTKWEIIFRWWNLVWWSLPYERAYGRQMRYIVWDRYHKAPMGLIGLQSPILSWGVRDNHLDIKQDKRDYWVNQSLNAQRLGALPPYNNLRGGKLVAAMMTTEEVRKAFRRKYKDKITEMEGRVLPPNLLFITTTGAYGKSSVYERLRIDGKDVAQFIGYTQGTGSFHIPNFLYHELLSYLDKGEHNTQRGFGSGPSRKIRLIQEALQLLGFEEGTNHHVKRSLYIFPLTENLKEVISSNVKPKWTKRTAKDVAKYWLNQWALPRAKKDEQFRDFDKDLFIKKALEEVVECKKVFSSK